MDVLSLVGVSNDVLICVRDRLVKKRATPRSISRHRCQVMITDCKKSCAISLIGGLLVGVAQARPLCAVTSTRFITVFYTSRSVNLRKRHIR